MATVHKLLKCSQDYINSLQKYVCHTESIKRNRFLAVLVIQRFTRGYLVRKHIAMLNFNATIIQCAFRQYLARQAYRAALRRKVKEKHAQFYNRNATIIQALWRGYWSRKTKFDYYGYRRWLAIVTERGAKKTYEAATFGIQSREENLKHLESEARKWLAYVVFRLHHLMRTYMCAGIYSDRTSHELSQFEQLLKSIHYTEYMNRLKLKYDEFVKEHKPKFSNKRLFPIIGEGKEYWYLTLPEMYDLTNILPEEKNTRAMATHHGPIHKNPFLWKKVRLPSTRSEHAGPFVPPTKYNYSRTPSAPPSTPQKRVSAFGDHVSKPNDPRFHLYVKHYKPDPEVFDYINYHINVLLKRKDDLHNLNFPEEDFEKND